MPFTAPATFTLPTLEPRPYGLSSVADVSQVSRLIDSVQYAVPSSDATSVLDGGVEQYCLTSTAQTLAGQTWATASVYRQEGVIECSIIGGNDYEAMAMESMELSRDTAMEAALSQIASGTTAEGLTITTLTAAGPEAALAQAQQAYAEASGARATVHTTPLVATYLADHIRHAGNHLETKIGALLGVEAGLTVPDANVIVVTGPVFVQQTSAQVYGPAYDTALNTEVVRAARDGVIEVVGPIIVAPVTIA